MSETTRADGPAGKSRLQSRIETAAIVAIAMAIVWQVFFARRGAPVLTSVQAQAARTTRPPATRPPEPPPPSDPIALTGAALQGKKGARVALVLFSDYQCPFCGRFERDTLPALVTKYVKSGQVLVAFREFPLSMHPFAEKAAEAAECAGADGKYWAMHDQLFQHQAQLDAPSLTQYASAVGLKTSAFETCLAGKVTSKVTADEALGKQLGVTGTPTFFIGRVQPDGRVKATVRLSGAQPVAAFQAALDRVIAAAGTK